mmetsp:Transcript_160029/g.282152  ORF Transcript_160029/g.282152 Transcript_160029/m.282152 type:complete len:81 (+) Transcript_160029:597-839(+)
MCSWSRDLQTWISSSLTGPRRDSTAPKESGQEDGSKGRTALQPASHGCKAYFMELAAGSLSTAVARHEQINTQSFLHTRT